MEDCWFVDGNNTQTLRHMSKDRLRREDRLSVSLAVVKPDQSYC